MLYAIKSLRLARFWLQWPVRRNSLVSPESGRQFPVSEIITDSRAKLYIGTVGIVRHFNLRAGWSALLTQPAGRPSPGGSKHIRARFAWRAKSSSILRGDQ